MSELTLMLDGKELIARMEAEILCIHRPHCEPQRFSLHMINSVIIIGSPMVSSAVFKKLAQHKITTLLLPTENGEKYAVYTGDDTGQGIGNL